MTFESSAPTNISCFVLDGGALLHRIPWDIGNTFGMIANSYVKYVLNHCDKSAIIVFDGYNQKPSTKYHTQLQRNPEQGPKIIFSTTYTLSKSKSIFLSNTYKKQRFILFLKFVLQEAGFNVLQAQGDADLLIVQTAVQQALTRTTVLVGDDTDLLVLSIFHYKSKELYFMSEPQLKSNENRQFLSISKVVNILGKEGKENILFIHALLGCDTTSRLFGVGKTDSLKLILENKCIMDMANIFLTFPKQHDEIASAGEKALLQVYKDTKELSLNTLRMKRFYSKVAVSQKAINPCYLPPTSSAAKFHSYRVYHQIQAWKNNELPPEQWGWKFHSINSQYIPIQTDQKPAPDFLLELVRCSCKSGCLSMRCSCRRQGFECTLACAECKGCCTNSDSHDCTNDSEENC